MLLEGPSDREYLQWVLEIIPTEENSAWPNLRSEDSHFLDYGGVKHLAGFLRATWEFIRSETCAVSVFDGDPAGEKERKDLQHYFGKKAIPFQPNEDFVSVRKGFPIESLFPDFWIKETYENHPGWFDDFSVDASGELESFDLKDGSKKSFANHMKEKAATELSLDWAERWINVCTAIDSALKNRRDKLEANKTMQSTVSVASAPSAAADG